MESISQTYERKKRRLESSDDTPGTKKFKVHVTLKYRMYMYMWQYMYKM